MESNKTSTYIIAGVFLIAGFIGGFAIAYTPVAPDTARVLNMESGKPSNADFSLFWEVWNMVSDTYVDKSKIDYKTMLYGAIDGMVNSIGDPYTSFFIPEENAKFQEDIAGSFSGIGIEISKKDGYLTVVAPLQDSPAQKAGVRSGERIIQIDDTSARDLAIEDAIALIRGKRGTTVTLTLLPASDDKTSREVSIVRDTIKVPTVEWRMVEHNNKSIAYIQIYSFNQNVETQFEKAANEILNSKADGIVLDLRGNPGGLLEASITISEWFLEKGDPITHEQFRDGSKKTFSASKNGLLRNYPLTVLIDEGSASASEILAGALSDSRGATLIGTTTFGKGSVQQLEELKDGSGIKITIAKWLTPNNVSISEKGIEPRFEVTISDEVAESEDFEAGEPGKDPQLDYAIDFISR